MANSQHNDTEIVPDGGDKSDKKFENPFGEFDPETEPMLNATESETYDKIGVGDEVEVLYWTSDDDRIEQTATVVEVDETKGILLSVELGENILLKASIEDGWPAVGQDSGNIYGYDSRFRVSSTAKCIHCEAVDDPENGIIIGLGENNETVCNVCRSEQLQEETVLKRREAETYGLCEQGYKDKQIANLLQNLHNTDSPQPGTISTHRSNIRKKLERARNTLNEVNENRL